MSDERGGGATLARLRNVWKDAAQLGIPLPGEQRLAEMLGASRPSLREALAKLESEGLIYRRHGAATAVNRAALEISGRFDETEDLREVLGRAGFEVRQELMRAEQIHLSEVEAAELGVEAGAVAMRIVKRWLADDSPAALAVDTFPLTRFEDLDVSEDLWTLAMGQLGEPVRWELAIPGAVNAEGSVAEWLGLEIGTAVLTVECLGVTVSGRRAYLATEYFRSNLARLGMIRTVHNET